MTKRDTESKNELHELLRRFPEPLWMSDPPAGSPPHCSLEDRVAKRKSLSRLRRFRPHVILIALGVASLVFIPLSFTITHSASALYAKSGLRAAELGPPMILPSSLLSSREPSRVRSPEKTCEIALKDLVQTTLTLRDALDLRRSIGVPGARSAPIPLQKRPSRDTPPQTQLPKVFNEQVSAKPSSSMIEDVIALMTPRQF